MSMFELLNEMRNHGGPALTGGLSDEVLERFEKSDHSLADAVREAHGTFRQLLVDEPELLAMDETGQINEIQNGYTNFYAEDAINPYVALAGNGPWVVSMKGAVIYDTGGYGMLGFGHNPAAVLDGMNQRHVMANIMTPNLSQRRLMALLRKEIGHTRGACPYNRFLCVNSGSESVTVGARLSDINAKLMTDPGGRHANKSIKLLSLKHSFHGRTQRPAQFSDSTRQNYCKHLASFRDHDHLITVDPNDVEQLKQVFSWADANNVFFEAFFFEPVMGEGNPGKAITPEFYAEARRLTREHGALMLIDSIQAGLRSHGVLSVIDYPGFENLEAPDMETYSKALNAGQYPLSVLAMNERASSLYQKGIYGNTMTTNPRALDVACAVLQGITPELRQNIRDRGVELVAKLKAVQKETGGRITAVQGTGLLVSAELDGSRYKSYGAGSTEEYMRYHGLNVIHGGQNSLRFTPAFGLTSEEVDLIVESTRQAVLSGPVRESAKSAVAA
ncbi:MAG: aminotransferase class III-fold pyridoxal phosphate-dependent enzyme [Xanthomonadales bacterium]|nr:aminotransferase class III-fold pyridoxal phosphate-dependent enzyme [Gammaproteobacteria bacterium]MBT8054360.1 aminotransferase class III-fold pyridoxal phosphate-dependent enzyme [Gammaproteobacteria bacterium]NND56476.1 aminotransferase class III-fold pyridoxal phosphate-dependent enzyme [Xanthomonadales bacterium]NNK51171.1 aminotransferase class III-fold pyridoxal phosphate-dependent enzyme [Xanthomonadales bacterium]